MSRNVKHVLVTAVFAVVLCGCPDRSNEKEGVGSETGSVADPAAGGIVAAPAMPTDSAVGNQADAGGNTPSRSGYTRDSQSGDTVVDKAQRDAVETPAATGNTTVHGAESHAAGSNRFQGAPSRQAEAEGRVVSGEKADREESPEASNSRKRVTGTSGKSDGGSSSDTSAGR